MNHGLTYTRLVLETLQPLSGDRKCFRMINGVLTERTVKEVVPILQTNSEGLKKALDELVKQYKSKQDEMEKWKVSVSCCVKILHVMAASLLLYGKWRADFGIAEEEQHPGCPTARAVDGFRIMRHPFDREGTRRMLGSTRNTTSIKAAGSRPSESEQTETGPHGRL
jgi:hypothetical protein